MSLVHRRTAEPAEGCTRRHADRDAYLSWVGEHHAYYARWSRMKAYDLFVARWPDLEDWFAAPLAERVDLPAAAPQGGPAQSYGGVSHDAMGYLIYLALVEGVGLDYELLLVRNLLSPFATRAQPAGLGLDLAGFTVLVERLTQLGYAASGCRSLLSWTLGRIVLHRGDPDLAAIDEDDLAELRDGLDAFVARPDAEQLRAAYARPHTGRPATGHAATFRQTALNRLHALHVLLFNTGQVTQPPSRGSRSAGSWLDRLVPTASPPKITAVIERYLRLRLDATDRPESVRHARDALRRLVIWLGVAHPEVTTLTRAHPRSRRGVSELAGLPAQLPHRRTGERYAPAGRRDADRRVHQ